MSQMILSRKYMDMLAQKLINLDLQHTKELAIDVV